MTEASFGKYRLIAELGQGGMADVFLAMVAGPAGSGFSKLTVIKRLRQNLVEDPEFVAMLVDEARIAARLNHPNVVQTNEVGQVDNQYFIAMEYLDGQPLHRIQQRAAHTRKQMRESTDPAVQAGDDPFPKQLEYWVLLDVLEGLHHAHELADYDGTPLQIVHRDVTPHNIFVTYEGQVKVVDFGIAKSVGRAAETQQGTVKGKVRYMAPEQAIGPDIDRRADIYSVGVMLWESIVGRRMWGNDAHDMQILQELVGGNVNTSPRDADPTVPEELDEICKKALAYDPESRYQTAEEFRLALDQYLSKSTRVAESRRKLGPAVINLFKDKRAQIRELIEQQITLMRSRPSAELVKLPSESTSTLSSARMPYDAGQPDEVSTHFYESARRNKSKRRWLAGAGVGAAILLVTGLFLIGGPSPGKQQMADEVHVKLEAIPPTALVTIDGAHVTVPYDVQVPRDSKDHVVRIEAAGFEPLSRHIQYTNDVILVFTLVKTETTVKPPVIPPPSATIKPPVVPTTTRWWPPPTTTKPRPSQDPQVIPVPTTPTAVPSVATTPAVDCTIPFTIDSAGVRHPKPMCD